MERLLRGTQIGNFVNYRRFKRIQNYKITSSDEEIIGFYAFVGCRTESV